MHASKGILAGFAALVLLFYAPVLFGKVLVDRDLFRLFIPDAHFLRQSLFAFEWPLWNPYQRLGQPFAATMQSQVYYPPHVVLVLLFAPARALSVQILLHVLLLSVGVYALCRTLLLSRGAAFVAGVVAGFTPLLTQMTSQMNILSALAWTGFQLVALKRFNAAPSSRGFALLAASFAVSLFAGSPEVLMMQTVIAATSLLYGSTVQRVIWSGFAVAAALFVGEVQLLPTSELAVNSIRAGGAPFRGDWSASFLDVLSLPVISVAGAPRSDFVPTTTLGVTALFFAALAFWTLRKSREARPFAICAAVFVVVSLGEHFPLSALLMKFPPLSLFRYPSRYLLGALFCLAVLAGFGAHAFRELPRKQKWISLGVVVGLQLVALAIAGKQPQVIWAVLFTGFVLAAATRQQLWPVAGVLVIELVAARFYLRAPGFEDLTAIDRPSALDQLVDHSEGARISVQLDDEDSRYAPPDLIAKSRDALFPLRFVEEGLEAFEGYGAPEPARVTVLTEQFQISRQLFDLASVKSFVRAQSPPFDDLSSAPIREGLPRVFLSSTALPRAFLAHQSATATDVQAADLLSEPTFNPNVVLLEPGAPLLPGADCISPPVTREVRSHQEQRFALDACADGYLFIGDAHFPGWIATVDDQRAKIVRANLLFRAVRVPPGKHVVVLRYSPASSKFGAVISLIAVIALVIAAARKPRDSTAKRASTLDN